MTARMDLFQFPCSYSLKVMGSNSNEFFGIVSAIVERHGGGAEGITYSSRVSSGGKYISITATFIARNREQLDAIYGDLRQQKLVVMVL